MPFAYSTLTSGESSSDAEDTAGSGESASASGYASPQRDEQCSTEFSSDVPRSDDLWEAILGLENGMRPQLEKGCPSLSCQCSRFDGSLTARLFFLCAAAPEARGDSLVSMSDEAAWMSEAASIFAPVADAPPAPTHTTSHTVSTGDALERDVGTCKVRPGSMPQRNVVRPGSKLQPAPPRPAVAPPPGRPLGKGIGIREPSPIKAPIQPRSLDTAPGGGSERMRSPSTRTGALAGTFKDDAGTKADTVADDQLAGEQDSGDGGDPSETAEEKRLRRMRRNRESAAVSRNRKKQYVEELEAHVACLNHAVRTLKHENAELRRECERLGGNPLPAVNEPDLSLMADALEQGFSSSTASEPLFGYSDCEARHAEGVPKGVKRGRASLLPNTSSKKVSAASLALMSAVTFVTFAFSGTRSHYHSATAGEVSSQTFGGGRMLMSLAPTAAGKSFRDDTSPLWPSLLHDTSDRASALYRSANARAPTSMPAHSGFQQPERVIRAPGNSSWADVLKIEAAERQLHEAQLALRQLRAASEMATRLASRPVVEHAAMLADEAKALLGVPHSTSTASSVPRMSAPSTNTSAPVYEHVEEEESDLSPSEYEAQRFIFCSRAYMFDAAVRRPQHDFDQRAMGADLDVMDSGIPPRFRSAPSRAATHKLPMLEASGNASAHSSNGMKAPVVTLLLPSAALQGVVGQERHHMPESGTAPAGTGRSDLMQVQCQVLNASRFTTSP